MTDLDILIREAAATGRLQAIQLFPSKERWQGNVKFRDNPGWQIGVDNDPILALCKALDQTTPAAPQPSGSVFD